jgi:hypothetical protein
MKKWRMAALLLVCAGFLGLCGCDDVTAPIQDNFSPPPPPPEGGVAPLKTPSELTRQDMEAMYNFILATRTSIQEMAAKVKRDLEEKRDQDLVKDRADFNTQYGVWRNMLLARRRSIEVAGKDYPEGHPATEIKSAISQLLMELDNYYREFNGMVPDSLDADVKLMETMGKVRLLLNDFPAPPPGSIPVK